MGYHPRQESTTLASFITTKCRNSEMWLINNRRLEEKILASFAVANQRYGAQLFALAIEGNHIQQTNKFPNGNRASYQRDVNSAIARAAPGLIPGYPGGRLFARRYSAEVVPSDPDIIKQFLYTVLQPVQDGLVERISDYPGYNCLHDAAHGIKRKFRIVRTAEFNADKKWKKNCKIQDYTTVVYLEFQRLPGYEHLSQEEYAKAVFELVEKKRLEIVSARKAEGKSFLGREKLLKKKPGSLPLNPIVSKRNDFRPRVLTNNPALYHKALAEYFAVYYAFKEASRRYRAGELNVEFPPGTYKPPIWCSGQQTPS